MRTRYVTQVTQRVVTLRNVTYVSCRLHSKNIKVPSPNPIDG